MSSTAQRCSLVCHPSTRSLADSADSGADVFTSDLLSSVSDCDPAVRLRPVDGFPVLRGGSLLPRLLHGLRHAHSASAGLGPCRAATSDSARTGRFPRSL